MPAFSAVLFDMYGTLFDVHSVARACEAAAPGQGDEMARLWRGKQLEYTWLRSLMGRYADFDAITADALRFVCAQLDAPLGEERQRRLAAEYLHLAPHPEAPGVLRHLHGHGIRTAILSNGTSASIAALVANAGMADLFDVLVSVDELKVFKPHPEVYALAERRLGVPRSEVLFVSANAWDAAGARAAGFPVCWINRYGNALDELGQEPDHVARDLGAMCDWIEAA
ncbi:MAG: haloacid dehalogenase type II [Telluria sp.]